MRKTAELSRAQEHLHLPAVGEVAKRLEWVVAMGVRGNESTCVKERGLKKRIV